MINLFKNLSTSLGAGKKLLVTHDSGFHADDVFAAAILEIYLENRNESYEIVRTRDPKTIERADYVFDVGGIYDASKNRFDHHQKGRAGARENGVMYAACGLVWRHFGEFLTKDKKAAEILDKRLFQSIDAVDNGQDINKSVIDGVLPYSISSAVGVFNLAWNEKDSVLMVQFHKAVLLAREIIQREIIQTKAALASEDDVREKYKAAEDKRVVIIDKPYSRHEITRVLLEYPEPIYFVYPKSEFDGWKVEGVRLREDTNELRKALPESWAGLRDENLQKVTGVVDAVFCHDGRFMARAKSKDGALALAKIAINS